MKPIITKFNTSTGDVEIMIPVPCRDPWESHINHPMSAYEENERYNIFYLIKENQELKKQLNSDDWINSIKETERHYIYSIENENEKLKKRLETKETQQKEFIEYLEDYIDALKQQKETVAELDISEVYSLMILEEVLEKYKEIIEVDN